MQSLSCATDTAQINGDTPYRFGFEDGMEGRSIFTGYDFFAGYSLQVYFEGHGDGVASVLAQQTAPVVDEAAYMDSIVDALQDGRMQPIVRLDPEQLYEIERERVGA